jgi:hypothetical protein
VGDGGEAAVMGAYLEVRTISGPRLVALEGQRVTSASTSPTT